MLAGRLAISFAAAVSLAAAATSVLSAPADLVCNLQSQPLVLRALSDFVARMLALQDAGSLEVGKSADFIVLDRDILALADSGHPEGIADTKVLSTWFQGKKVYAADKH